MQINCRRGNARLRLSKRGMVQILTGRRRKWDGLHWSLLSDSEVALQGLIRGSYADAVASIDDFAKALRELGANSLANSVEQAATQSEAD